MAEAVGKIGERGGGLEAQVALLQMLVSGFDVGRIAGDDVEQAFCRGQSRKP